MIAPLQIKNLAKFYLIDEFTVQREYLQLLFLSYLYQTKEAKSIYFKGGTAIRLLFGSPRFSEDLDFSTTYQQKQIAALMKRLETLIGREIPRLTIKLWYSGRNTSRFRLKYQSKDFKYPTIIRLDFHRVEKTGRAALTPLETKFPVMIFPPISHLTKEAVLAEKIHALVTRAKGRDFFDVWYLLTQGVILPSKINKRIVVKKIKNYPQAQLKRDLVQFLPKPQRNIIGLLKENLLKHLS